ncbi:MAG TPA: alpha/beta hydrolase [Pseudonocardiaceae bacterium]|nr:alpha/beta hydrolase [Pseudonocardiaceae bacterium]
MTAPTSVSNSFRVTASALTDAANDLNSQASQLSTLAGQITGSTLTAQAFGQLTQSGQVAQAHNDTVNTNGQNVTAAGRRTSTLATGLTNSANGYTQADQTVAGWYRSLLAGQSTTGTSQTTAGAQSTTGAFASQIAANRPKVRSALTDELDNQTKLQYQLTQLRQQDQQFGTDDFGRTVNSAEEQRLSEQITQSQQKIALYQDILTNNRQIIAFDPTGNGKIAELTGTIGPNTTDVGVLVPGTGTNMSDFDFYSKVSGSFVTADPNGHLAMVTWANGTFPQNLITQAPDPSYAQQSAPDLASFSHDLRDQINQQLGPNNNVQVTVAGHSYGAATVGLAEQNGLDANRVLYVEGAGVGHDVWSPSDLHDMQSNVQRFSMTAPTDPIALTQGVQVFGLGHGADPDTFPGVADLATGNYPNGQPITGPAGHTGVFTTGSTAWQNMFGVFTGGPTTPAPVRQPLTPDPMFLGP